MGYSKTDEETLWNLVKQLDDLVSKETLRKNEIEQIRKFLSVMSDIKLSAHPTTVNHLEQFNKIAQNTIGALKEYSLDCHIEQETFDCVNEIVKKTKDMQDSLSWLQENLSLFDRRIAYKMILEKNNINQIRIADTICKLTNSMEVSRNSFRSEINKIINCVDNRKSYPTNGKENEQSEQPYFWDLMILALYFKINENLLDNIHTFNQLEIYSQYIENARTFFIKEWAKLLPTLKKYSSSEEADRKKILMAELLYNDGMEDVIYNLFNVKS